MSTLTAGRFTGTFGLSIFSRFSEWAEVIRQRRERKRSIAAMRSVDPRILKDIGIDRSEITSIIHSAPHGGRLTHDRF